jgi:hypothetical protein
VTLPDAPSALRGRDEMTVGVIAAAQFQSHSPSQQMGLRRLTGAECLQPDGRPVRLAQQLGRRQAGPILRLDKHEPCAGSPPGTVLGPE